MDITGLHPFRGHPFHEYEGERLEDMAESVRAHGVMVPIITRRVDDGLEILSGHNRVKAAKLAGLSTVPAFVLDNLTDEEAWFYVVETNLMQRSFTDMTHSEKVAVIAMQHSQLFSPGKRNDILKELAELEKSHKIKENGTSPQVGERLHADQQVGAMYSLSVINLNEMHDIENPKAIGFCHTHMLLVSSKKLNKRNTSGIRGVCWIKDRKKWIATITFQGKCYRLGGYKTIEEAAAVRKQAEEMLFEPFLKWWNENFGNMD